MNLSGSMTALATPFRNGALDEEAYRALVRQQLGAGTAALLPMGTTGEAMTMTPAERIRAVRLAVEEVRGRVPVIAGAGSNSTAETVEAMARVREAGADGALVVTPYYNKPTPEGQYRHFKAIHDAVDIPILIYNVPPRSAVDPKSSGSTTSGSTTSGW